MSHKTVLDIYKDQFGLFWFTTQGTVVRYDGHETLEVKSFFNAQGKEVGLTPVKVFSDNRGAIFLADLHHGLMRYNEAQRRFEGTENIFSNRRSDDQITAAFSDKTTGSWIGFSSGDIGYLEDGTFKQLSSHTQDIGAINDIFASEGGDIFFLTDFGNVFRATSEGVVPALRPLPPACKIQGLVANEGWTKDGNTFLFGTQGHGLYKFDELGCNHIPLDPATESSNLTIHDIKQSTESGEVWVGSDSGLYIIDESFSVRHFTTSNSDLSDNEVTSVFPSGEQVSWVGSFRGIDVLVTSHFELFDEMSGDELRSVVAIDSSRKLGTWVATYNSLLQFIENQQNHRLLQEAFPAGNISTSQIMALLVDKHTLWVGYRNSGVAMFDTRTGQVRLFTTANSDLSSDSVTSFLRLSDGDLLIGTYGGGLNILARDGKVRSFEPGANESSISGDRVIALHQAESGDIQVITETSVQIFRKDLGKFITINNRNSITAARILFLSIEEDPLGRIWLGSAGNGLFFLNDQGEIQSAAISSLRNESIYAIQSAESGELWFSTNSGLSRLATDGSLTNFSYRHGLQATEFDFGASHKDSQGRMYFGGSNGYNRFHPADIDVGSEPPPVVLTGLDIAGRPYELRHSLQETQRLELDYTDYYLTLVFSALDFIDPGNNLYRHKLVGFDPDWVDTGNRNSATYTNLPPGSYTLRVQGASAAGIWNHDGLNIDLQVNPPPWRTAWAWCVYIALAAFVLWHLRKTYDNYLVRTHAVHLAEEMRITADRAADEVQEQLDDQARLVRTIHRFNEAELCLIADTLESDADSLPDGVREAFLASHGARIEALKALEASLLYRYDELLADLHQYTERLITLLLPRASLPPERIVLINEVSPELVPARKALPLAVILFELVANALDHAFEPDTPVGYLTTHLSFSYSPTGELSQIRLLVADSGAGIPEAISFTRPETPGFAAVNACTRNLQAHLRHDSDNGARIEVLVPLAVAPVSQ